MPIKAIEPSFSGTNGIHLQILRGEEGVVDVGVAVEESGEEVEEVPAHDAGAARGVPQGPSCQRGGGGV